MKEAKPIVLDGRTGEGGGQLVRLATALSAVSSIPIRITHVRGNRGGGRGGGLKAQHVASIAYLATATDAVVTGLHIGSHTLEFRPRLQPSQLVDRKVRIVADSAAASTLLIFQAVLPFLLFAGGEAVEVVIQGGTNVSWSLSWEYLDQVLLPVLEDRFGVVVERRLVKRGWSAGKLEAGEVWFRVHPVKLGDVLRLGGRREYAARDFEVKTVHVSILAPADMHAGFQDALVADLEVVFPRAEVDFRVVEDTGLESRIYVLCVARSETLRWGRDCLSALGKKGRKVDVIRRISQKVCKELFEEVEGRGTVDEYLQDQLVVFQALADGMTSFPRGGMAPGNDEELEEVMEGLTVGERMRRDKALEPFGEGSTHTTTARWVTAEVLEGVEWFNKGRVCRGVGMRMERPPETA